MTEAWAVSSPLNMKICSNWFVFTYFLNSLSLSFVAENLLLLHSLLFASVELIFLAIYHSIIAVICALLPTLLLLLLQYSRLLGETEKEVRVLHHAAGYDNFLHKIANYPVIICLWSYHIMYLLQTDVLGSSLKPIGRLLGERDMI